MKRVSNAVARGRLVLCRGRVFLVLAASPFYWMLITDLYNVTNVSSWFDYPPTLGLFRYLLEERLRMRWVANPL